MFDKQTGPLYKNISNESIDCLSQMEQSIGKPKIVIERVNGTWIRIPQMINDTTDLQCYAHSVRRSPRGDSFAVGGTIYGPFHQEWAHFPLEDAVLVRCYQQLSDSSGAKKETLTDSKIVPLISQKSSSTTSSNNQPSSNRPNVLVLGIDSVSELQFRRHFNLTQKFMNENGFRRMLGFTKIDDNTFPNMMAVLTGHQYTDFWNYSMNMVFDDVPTVWKDFKKKGYLTSLIEDKPKYTLFNYERAGFKNQPTDYYLRPVSLLVNNERVDFCYRDQLTMQVR